MSIYCVCQGLSNKDPGENTGPYGLHPRWYSDGGFHEADPGIVRAHLDECATNGVTHIPIRAPAGYLRAAQANPLGIYGMDFAHWFRLTPDQQDIMRQDVAEFLLARPDVEVGIYVLGWISGDPRRGVRSREVPLNGFNDTHWRWFVTEMQEWLNIGCTFCVLDHACLNLSTGGNRPGDWRSHRPGMVRLAERSRSELGLRVMVEGLARAARNPSSPAWDFHRACPGLIQQRNIYSSMLQYDNTDHRASFAVPGGVEMHVLKELRDEDFPVSGADWAMLDAMGWGIGYFSPPGQFPDAEQPPAHT